ncbi:MAG: nuclear transport factor 2 family protein [Microthrixaceae bacterium]|nr:nuclear transport factor 2 family protein [Microthrixaceae bacterium]
MVGSERTGIDRAGFDRTEIEAMVQRWLDANRAAEAAGDWKPMADLYTEDATYGWNYGADTDFMAVGREEIRELALGAEMGGLDGWSYPYEEIIIDETKAMVVGFWRQVADARRDDGSEYEVRGIGGSWFRYAGDGMWNWQRDWFDFGNAAALFLEMMGAGVLSDGMTERMNRSMRGPLPGYYPAGQSPVGIWER